MVFSKFSTIFHWLLKIAHQRTDFSFGRSKFLTFCFKELVERKLNSKRFDLYLVNGRFWISYVIVIVSSNRREWLGEKNAPRVVNENWNEVVEKLVKLFFFLFQLDSGGSLLWVWGWWTGWAEDRARDSRVHLIFERTGRPVRSLDSVPRSLAVHMYLLGSMCWCMRVRRSHMYV